MIRAIAAVALVALVAACGGGGARPAARYPVPAEVGAAVIDAGAFARIAGPARRDVTAELARGVADVTARKDRLFLIAMLDALDDHWPAAVAGLDAIRALETDHATQVMTGLSIRVWADAIARGEDSADGFRAALERTIASLPIDEVRGELSMLRAMGQAFTPDACRQLVDQAVGPAVVDGTIGYPELGAVVFQRYAVVRLAPVGAVIDQVLAAHGIELPAEGAP